MRRKRSSAAEALGDSAVRSARGGTAASVPDAERRGARLVRAVSAWLPVIGLECLVLFLSTRPHLAVPGSIPHLDKAAHFAEYALLGGLLQRALSLSGVGRNRAWALVGLLAAGLSAGDEWVQSHVPGRDSSPLDWLADCIGAGAGAWLMRQWIPGRGRSGPDARKRGTEG